MKSSRALASRQAAQDSLKTSKPSLTSKNQLTETWSTLTFCARAVIMIEVVMVSVISTRWLTWPWPMTSWKALNWKLWRSLLMKCWRKWNTITTYQTCSKKTHPWAWARPLLARNRSLHLVLWRHSCFHRNTCTYLPTCSFKNKCVSTELKTQEATISNLLSESALAVEDKTISQVV